MPFCVARVWFRLIAVLPLCAVLHLLPKIGAGKQPVAVARRVHAEEVPVVVARRTRGTHRSGDGVLSDAKDMECRQVPASWSSQSWYNTQICTTFSVRLCLRLLLGGRTPSEGNMFGRWGADVFFKQNQFWDGTFGLASPWGSRAARGSDIVMGCWAGYLEAAMQWHCLKILRCQLNEWLSVAVALRFATGHLSACLWLQVWGPVFKFLVET